MKKQKLRQCLFTRVRLRPAARSIPTRHPLHPNDDTWIVTAVRQGGVVELSNIVTGHVAQLGADHIHHFDSDPMSETDGLKHGFLTLTVQVHMRGCNLSVEPLPSAVRRRLPRRS